MKLEWQDDRRDAREVEVAVEVVRWHLRYQQEPDAIRSVQLGGLLAPLGRRLAVLGRRFGDQHHHSTHGMAPQPMPCVQPVRAEPPALEARTVACGRSRLTHAALVLRRLTSGPVYQRRRPTDSG